MEKYSTIVVGAGIAGISACIELTRAGHRVLLLEARDRIGGRISTYRKGGVCIDLGASWFHECETNELVPIAQRQGIATYQHPVGGTSHCYSKAGFINITPEAEEAMERVLFAAQQEFKNASNDQDMSLRDFTLKKIEEVYKHESEARRQHICQQVRWMELWHGVSWAQLSAKYSANESEGGDLYVSGGYDKVVEHLFDQIDHQLVDLQLNREVAKIHKDNDKVVVTTKDEQTFVAPYAIVTLPMSVLKATHKEMFSPSLPEDFRSLLDNSIFAALGKVAFVFSEPFWPQDEDHFMFLGSSIDPDDVTQWSCPTYVVNGSVVCGQPVLVFLTAPPFTQHVEKNPSQVKALFEPLLKALRTDQSAPLPQPVDTVVTNWTQDPYALGSYSGTGVGQDFMDSARPFIQGFDRVRFAGEHTTIEANGCAHGAFLTGKREAQHIISNFSRP